MTRRTPLHEGWEFAAGEWALPNAKLAFSSLEFLPATVPGHVHTDLVAAGVIGDPFERLQELGCQWVDERSFLYRKRFTWTASGALPRRCLRFEGLDGVCTISLNGVVVASHDNMFLPLELDVTGLLVEGENELQVAFESSVRVGRERRKEYFAREGLSEEIERFDERSFVRKAQFMYGWDWGPRLVSCGIWRSVWLEEFTSRLRDVRVVQHHGAGGEVRVEAWSEYEGEGTLVHCFEGEPPRSGDGAVATLCKPRLWYPVGLGAQPLYTLTSYLCPPGFRLDSLPAAAPSARAQLGKVALDQRTTRVGLRAIVLDRTEDELGRRFEFRVNGLRMWALGANWIPQHSFPSQTTRDDIERLLLRARDAGMNMLRIWGGGLYESDDFYELCDELGLLVWQDFPFACAYYPEDDAAAQALRREAGANIRRLRNHASLAIWCGNNENLEMYSSAWGGAGCQPPRYYGERLYDEVLPQLLGELDSGRPYIPSSPHGGSSPNALSEGDQHYWDVWHGRGDWIHYDDSHTRFSSEFGFAASCSAHAWARVLGPTEEDPQALARRTELDTPVVRWHDKTGKGQGTFRGFVELHYPPAECLADWIYSSQLNQRDAMRYAIEHYRRSTTCRGALIWQLNDCWPVQSWALIDSELQPKMSHFELRRLTRPLLLSVHRRPQGLQIWVILDNSAAARSGTLKLALRDAQLGTLLHEASATVRITPGERLLALELPSAELPSQPASATATFAEASSVQLLCEPKELRLPAPLELRVRRGSGRLEVEAPGPVFDVCLEDAEGTKHFGDNCLTFACAGQATLSYGGGGQGLIARSLAGRHPIAWGD